MKVAVIGGGRWGKNHIRTLNGLNALGGIIDSNQDTLNGHKELYPQVKTFESLAASGALAFDAYTVATPAATHFKIAKSLLEQGKHVMVEKPITLTSEDAKELCRVAREKKCTLMVGHVMLFHPAIQKIKELIESGKIGKVEYLYSNRLNLGAIRTEENSLWSFAPHDISIFQYFIGNLPEKVVSSGGAFLQPSIHDTTMTILHYPQNIVGHIFVSWLHPFKEHRIVVIGSKGMLSYEDSSAEKNLYYYEKGFDWVQGEPVKRDGPTETIAYDRGQPLTSEMQSFIDCATGKGKNDRISGEKGVEVLQILEQAGKSIDSMGDTTTINEPSVKEYKVHETSAVDEGCTIGKGTSIWHYSHVQKGTVIGKKCTLGQNVNIANNVKIGSFVKIQNNVSVYEGVELEDYVFCGPSMVFTNVMNPRCKYPQRGAAFYHKTLVKEGASIGANATIICGNTIGRFAFIGAGTVVTKDVPDFAMMVGNPAKRIGWMSEAGEKLDFSTSNTVTCQKSGVTYTLVDGVVKDV